MLRHRLTDLISGRVGRSEVKLDFGPETSSAIDGHVKYVEKKDAFLANRRVATTIKRTCFYSGRNAEITRTHTAAQITLVLSRKPASKIDRTSD